MKHYVTVTRTGSKPRKIGLGSNLKNSDDGRKQLAMEVEFLSQENARNDSGRQSLGIVELRQLGGLRYLTFVSPEGIEIQLNSVLIS